MRMSWMTDPQIERAVPYLYLVFSACAFFFAWGGGRVFSSSELVMGTAWTTTGGYNTKDFLGLVAQTALLPVAIVCFLVGMPHAVQARVVPTSKVIFLFLVLGIIGLGIIIAYASGAHHILKCGVAFCIYTDINDDGYEAYSFQAYTSISLTLYFFVLVYFFALTAPAFVASICAAVDARRTKLRLQVLERRKADAGLLSPEDATDSESFQGRRIGTSKSRVLVGSEDSKRSDPTSGADDSRISAETREFSTRRDPLEDPPECDEESALLSSPSSPSSNLSWTSLHEKGDTSTRCRLLVGGACYFVVALPGFILSAALLPDVWLDFLPSGLLALATTPETSADDTTAGPVLSFKIGKANGSDIYAKFWPDLLLFYGALYLVVGAAILIQVLPFNGAMSRFLRLRPAPPCTSQANGSNMTVAPRSAFITACGQIVRALSDAVSVGGVSIASFCFGVMLALLLAALFWYWYLFHGFNYSKIDDLATSERVARSLGQVQNAVLGLLILPTARNSVWPAIFGVSWEAGIALHRWLGRLFLLLVLAHAVSWYVYYGSNGWFPHDVWSVELDNSAWPSDFSILLVSLVSVVSAVTMGVLSLNYIRRKHFEVFYFAHHTFLALFLAILWHAPSAWYYILPGLALWCVDHAVRFCNACRRVKVLQFQVQRDVISLGYMVEQRRWKRKDRSPTRNPSTATMNRWAPPFYPTAIFEPLSHDAGQYVFLNFPDISLLEWHPFTISSAPGDSVTTHHIRKMIPPPPRPTNGSNSTNRSRIYSAITSTLCSTAATSLTFTSELHLLAMQYTRAKRSGDNETLPPSLKNEVPLRVNIDGPYGLAVDYQRYGSVLFIGGGIGITPLHSAYRALLRKNAETPRGQVGDDPEGSCYLETIRLLWTVRSPSMLELFHDTWHQVVHDEELSADGEQQEKKYGKKRRSGYFGKKYGKRRSQVTRGGQTFSLSLWADEAEKEMESQRRCTVPFSEGRPDLRREIELRARQSAATQKPALVFVCHVPAVARIAGSLCQEFGVDFHTETFEL